MQKTPKNSIGELNNESHWNKVYNRHNTEKPGWYENYPELSIKLIDQCKLDANAVLLNVGVGTSTLIDELIKLKYNNVIATDISSISLEKLKKRLGVDKRKVKWIVDDLTKSEKIINLPQVDLWHDRAVLHFFNEKKEQDNYFDLVHQLVKKNGFVIIAAFNLNGSTKCSGLPVFRYDKAMLVDKIGSDFECVKCLDFTFNKPYGDTSEYIYTLFKRVK